MPKYSIDVQITIDLSDLEIMFPDDRPFDLENLKEEITKFLYGRMRLTEGRIDYIECESVNEWVLI